MSKGERYTLFVALGIAVLIYAPWFYTQLLVWKEEGHDHMLTVANIIVTTLLWAVLLSATWNALRRARRLDSLEAQLQTVKDDSKTQIEHNQRLATDANDKALWATKEQERYKLEASCAIQERDGYQHVAEKHVNNLHYYERVFGPAVFLKRLDVLKTWTTTVAGSLYSVLVEFGEPDDDPYDAQAEATGGVFPGIGVDPDPNIIARLTQLDIPERLRVLQNYAWEQGLRIDSLDKPIQNSHDVRARIRALRALSAAIKERYPDVPHAFASEAQ